MSSRQPANRHLFLAAFVVLAGFAHATNLDTIGATALLANHPELNGSGQIVAIVEAPETDGDWQVSPSAVGKPSALFDYYDGTNTYGGGGSTFTSSLASGHANHVGQNFFGATTGVAPGVDLVENFEANYFYTGVIQRNNGVTWMPVPISSKIVNQSWIVNTTDSATISTYSRFYDAYVNQFGTLFVNGANNSNNSNVYAPGSMYNGITVGRESGAHSGGVHLVAPDSATSYATPYVSGSAAVLRQAAEIGHFGEQNGTNPADSRVLKVALINGATKTAGWSQTETNPLDNKYGAGMVNVNTSYETLAGGQHSRSLLTSESRGTVDVGTDPVNIITSLKGWDLTSVSTSISQDAAAHYFFDLSAMASVSLTATLTWNSIANVYLGTNTIRDFDLVLIDSLTDFVVWNSHSSTENVEHISISGLAGSLYELQVILRGAAGTSYTDTYALAWSWNAITTVPEPGEWMALGVVSCMVLIAIRRRLSRP